MRHFSSPSFKRLFSILGLVILSLSAGANPYGIIEPEEVGLSSERLERVDKLIESSIEAKEISGAAALLARKGKIAYFKAFGLADLDEKIPMKQDAIFRIASMSKAITCAAVMALYEEGLFGLDDPLSDYIPEFKEMKVLIPHEEGVEPAYHLAPAERAITIRHLLTHSSGIPYGGDHIDTFYKENDIYSGIKWEDDTIGEMVKRLGGMPLLHHPGTHWDYGLSIDVLGRLVEIWSGQSFDVFLRERLFDPLKMEDTFFYVPEDKQPRLAAIHKQDEDQGLIKIQDEWKGPGAPATYFSGGGGLCSTTYDYYRFCQMMLNQGALDGYRLLSRKTVELMLRDHLGAMGISFQQKGFSMGYGFSIHMDQSQSNKISSEGSFGWGGYWGTQFSIDPVEDMVMIIMTQNLPSGSVKALDQFQNLVYQAIDD